MSELEGLPPGEQAYIEARQVEVDPDRSRICSHDSDEERDACEKCDRGLLPVELSQLPPWAELHESWTTTEAVSHPRDPLECSTCRLAMFRGRPA